MARSTLWKHRKFRRLEMALKSKALAAGVLECLWSCGYESGDDLIGTSDEIERACGWSGKRGALAPLLLSIGWIDETSEGYRIHDLFDHAPQYVKRRCERDHKTKANDTPMASQRLASGKPVKSQPTTTTTTSLPTPTTSRVAADAPPESERPSTEFEEFWNRYPNKTGWGAAARAWVENVNGSAAQIVAALAWQVKSKRWTEDGGRWVPNPEKYLKDRMWLDAPTKVHDAFLDGDDQ